MLTTTQILENAKQLIETYGWVQGEAGDCLVGYCMIGAMHKVLVLNEPPIEAYKQADRILRDGMPTRSFINFNDAPERTKEDVLAVFDKAITLAEKSNVDS